MPENLAGQARRGAQCLLFDIAKTPVGRSCPRPNSRGEIARQRFRGVGSANAPTGLMTAPRRLQSLEARRRRALLRVLPSRIYSGRCSARAEPLLDAPRRVFSQPAHGSRPNPYTAGRFAKLASTARVRIVPSDNRVAVRPPYRAAKKLIPALNLGCRNMLRERSNREAAYRNDRCTGLTSQELDGCMLSAAIPIIDRFSVIRLQWVKIFTRPYYAVIANSGNISSG
jgi:hypothetical protein